MITLIKFLLRLAGYVLLAAAFVAAVVDGSKSVAASAFVYTPLREIWSDLSAASLAATLDWLSVSRAGNMLLPLFDYPLWAVAAPVGIVLLWLLDRRARRPISA